MLALATNTSMMIKSMFCAWPATILAKLALIRSLATPATLSCIGSLMPPLASANALTIIMMMALMINYVRNVSLLALNAWIKQPAQIAMPVSSAISIQVPIMLTKSTLSALACINITNLPILPQFASHAITLALIAAVHQIPSAYFALPMPKDSSTRQQANANALMDTLIMVLPLKLVSPVILTA